MLKPIYIALGANLGQPVESFVLALTLLKQNGVKVISLSGLWQSPAWPAGSDAPDYVNACAEIDFSGDAREMLALLHQVEAALGRERSKLNAPRTLDLDLLDFRGEIIVDSEICIPHSRMMGRGFVLLPLSQIAEVWRNPISNKHINAAVSELPLCDVAPLKYLGRKGFDINGL